MTRNGYLDERRSGLRSRQPGTTGLQKPDARYRLPHFPTLGRDAMLLLLTCAAGSVDAISYLGLGHVFTAMMTGNTVLLGLAVAQQQATAALRSLLALGGFAAGVVIGATIVERDRKKLDWPPVVTGALAVEGVILCMFTIGWHLTETARNPSAVHALIVLSGIAMGIQSVAIRHLNVPGIATTYITGTLTSLVVGLVSWLHAAAASLWTRGSAANTTENALPAARWERRIGLLAAVFWMYGFGALLGGILLARSSRWVTLSPLVAVSLVVVNAVVRHGHQQNARDAESDGIRI